MSSWRVGSVGRSSFVAYIVLALGLTACGGDASQAADPEIGGQQKPMVLAPGWVTGSAWPAETVVALNSVAVRSSSLVRGDVGVVLRGSSAFLDSGAELSIATNAEIDGSVRADTINMQVAGHVLGNASYNELVGPGSIDGTRTTTLTTPVPITVVAASNFSAGTTNVTVSAGTTSTRSSGSYGTITVNSGSATSRAVLRLNGGTYNIGTLTLGNYARVECLASCELRVKNRVSVASYGYIGPGGKNNLNMSMVKLFVEGTNGVQVPTGTPAAASFAAFSELKAFTFVPNGTLSLGANSTNVGKFIAKDVDIGADAELVLGSAEQRPLLLPYVAGGSWPNEVITAFNSIDLLSSTVLSGNAAVIQNGAGPFLNGREAVLGTSARLNGSLRADRVELKSGSVVTGQVRYNSITNAGTAGALLSPLPLPLDIRVPVFPVITSGSAAYTVSSTLDRTLAPGRYRDVTLYAGQSTNYTVLTLTGGIYEMRRLTLGNYSSVVCAAACEIRVKDRINPGDNTTLGPIAGLDASKVKVFVYRENSSPTSTPFAVSFGLNAQVDAFLFAPRGTLEAKTGARLRGRFVARDIRLGSSGTSERTGTTELAPVIQEAPQSVTVVAGQSATFMVTASGTDVAFQWRRNGVAIAGATTGSYTVANTMLSDSGAMFTVTVSNGAGTVTSAAALLTVNVCDPGTYEPVPTSCGVGACARTGTRSCVSGQVVDSCSAGAPAANDTTCNGIDNDCNGQVDEDFVPTTTSCGAGACADTGVTSCVSGMVQDSCDASAPAANDATCDGRDDDCDGRTDEDYTNVPTTCGVGACADTGVASCVGGAIVDSCTEGAPALLDDDCDGIDDDCDGEADQDYDSVTTSCGTGACRATGATDCVSGVVVDSCRAGTNAPNDATCNGVDDDCNGQIDEDYVATVTNCGIGACRRTGATSCVQGEVENSCLPGAPAANDTTCNGIDNDCNGQNDEDYVSVVTSCGSGTCTASGATSCTSGSVNDSCVVPTADRDGDGSRDCADLCPDHAAKVAPGVCGCAVADVDGDADGRADCIDACPLDPDDDFDGDGVCGDMDNCPAVANAGQENVDGDSDGDACDSPTSTAIAAGGLHGCAVVVGGRVGCWGDNEQGQLGNGTRTKSALPVMVSGLSDAVEVTTGYTHSCARRSTGQVVCWGENANGELGNGSTTDATVPVAVPGISDAVQVSAGHDHTCVRRSGGSVSCWGSNANHQIDATSTALATSPVTIAGLSDATQVGAGFGHSCALRSTGGVVCWGANWYGEIGSASQAIEVDALAPVAVTGLSDATQLGVGGLHNCARRASGAVVCWGANINGQLGNGTTTDALTPVTVTGLSDAVSVRAGLLHSCARRTGGAVSCWGYNTYGQVGNGSYADALTASPVTGLTDATDLAAGDTHTCALRSSGELSCWGDASSGQLAGGAVENASTPMTVVGQAGAQAVSVGSTHVCVRTTGSAVSCWGFNQYGQLGDGTSTLRTTGATISGLAASAVSAGFVHACARRASGDVRCWGRGSDGQLGNGALSDALSPVTVSGLTDATQVAAGGSHTCAVRSGGTVQCWGDNAQGQLGNGSTADASSPVTVSGLTGVSAVAAGGLHSCALLASGGVRCWGEGGQGRLGHGATADSLTPVTVSGISDAVAIAAGDAHTCARRSNGQILCWGEGSDGQLGDGRSADSSVPVTVASLANASQLATGTAHSCATLSTGQVRCWGRNDDGQLGNGERVDASTPVAVTNLFDVAAVSGGYHSTCAVLNDGSVRCWGNGTFGELGNGYPWSGVPTRVLW